MPDSYHPPAATTLDYIYQDDHLLVTNKPAGLLAVPGRGVNKQDSLITRIQAQFPDALVVHRLDMATSGLMLFARGAEMQSRLSKMFRERQIEKRYLAEVDGMLAQDYGEIDLPISSDWPNRPKQKVDMSEGKPSLTQYHLLSVSIERGTSRVLLEPITGRTHQLRVHLAAIGHPILGDPLYGDVSKSPRLLLHASNLGLIHPITGMRLDLQSVPDF